MIHHLSFIGRMRAAYGLALVLLVGLNIGAYFLVGAQLNERDYEAELTSLVGQQSSLAQRITLLASRLAWTENAQEIQTSNIDLSAAIVQMRANHARIQGILINPKVATPSVRDMLLRPPLDFQRVSRNFTAEAERISKLDNRRDIVDALDENAALRRMSRTLRDNSAQVTDALVASSKEHIIQFDRLNVLLTLLMVLLAISLVFAVFRPLERRITADRAHLRDVNERLEQLAAERADELAQSERRAQSVLNTVLDGIITIDSRGIIQTVNPAAEKLFAYGRADMLGRNVNFLMPEPFHSAHDGYLHNYLVTGNKKIIGIGREVTGRRADGSTFPMELAVSEMEVSGERMFTGIVRDIGARKQAEAELRAVTAMRQAILDSANYSIIATNTEGVISVFNQGAQRMLGYTEAEMVDRQTPAIIHLPDEVVARAKALSAELGKPVEPGFEVFVAKTRAGDADENEWTYVRKDGSTLPVLLSVTALFDDAGKIYGYLGIGSDITERKRVDKMKREFISTVSHELRTPLTSIRGALGLVAGGATGAIPDKARELVSIASNNCDRLVRLINDILDMEKIESGKMTFDMRPVDLRILVEEAVAANQAYAVQHRVKIAVEGKLPPAEVIGDRDRLIQVLTNLLSNAAKFTAPGGTVHVSLDETPGAAMLRVRDEGPGIPEEFQSRIFQKFSQADSSDTRSKGGSGLGLSITKAIVEYHGGQIGFETAAGQGATFWVRLPAQPAAEAGEHQPGQARVLVVEDDRDVAKLLRLILEQEGYAVDVAYSIVQARERLDAGRYAAITLDLLLPGESGMSFVRELRERPESVALPIVVVSAVVERGRKELNGAAVSVLDWLEKPIDEERLLKAVAEAVKVSGGKRRVLHVEDDPDIAHILSTMLEGIAELDLAPTLKQAHACLDSNDYALVILDIGLPDGSGLDLLPRLAQIKPPIPILVFSAQELNAHDSRQVSAAFVKSRTDIDSLVRAIRANLAARDKSFVK